MYTSTCKKTCLIVHTVDKMRIEVESIAHHRNNHLQYLVAVRFEGERYSFHISPTVVPEALDQGCRNQVLSRDLGDITITGATTVGNEARRDLRSFLFDQVWPPRLMNTITRFMLMKGQLTTSVSIWLSTSSTMAIFVLNPP